MKNKNNSQTKPENNGMILTVVVALVLGIAGVFIQIFAGVASDVEGWMDNLPPVNAGLSILVAFLALLLFARPKWFNADHKTMQDVGVGLAIFGLAQACGSMVVALAS